MSEKYHAVSLKKYNWNYSLPHLKKGLKKDNLSHLKKGKKIGGNFSRVLAKIVVVAKFAKIK